MKKKDLTAKGTMLKDRVCAVCGGKFDVKLENNNRIPIQYFYSKELGETLTGSKSEYWECEYCSGFFKERVKEWMIKNWGTRCPDYEENCPLCKAWKYFDYLFEIDL
jgi:rubrerythrin